MTAVMAGTPCTWEPADQIEIDRPGAHFGESVSAGDVDGNGYNDVAVGAHGFTNDSGLEGRAYLFPGSADGMSREPVWVVEEQRENSSFGWRVAASGDLNGDGYDDVVVSDPEFDGEFSNSGALFAYLGSANGLSERAASITQGPAQGNRIGSSVAFAGDVDGDGYDDVVTGTGLDNKAYLYRGTPSGLASTPDWRSQGVGPVGAYGWSVASAGDVNADGYDDVIVGSPWEGFFHGKAYLFLGSADGLTSGPVWQGQSTQEKAYFGLSVASAGDVNGDGYGDVVIGAPEHFPDFSGLPQFPTGVPQGPDVDGFAYVYFGSSVVPFRAASVPEPVQFATRTTTTMPSVI